MEVVIGHLMEALFMPQGLMILLVLSGWRLKKRYARIGRTLIAIGFGQIIILSMPIIANNLIQRYEYHPALTNEQINSTTATAIVILGGGHYFDAPEYQQDSVTARTLERLRYAVYLHGKTQLPLLVSGGNVYGPRKSEAEIIKQILKIDYQVEVRWLEINSRTTFENAVETKKILRPAGVDDILLVTQAWHMPRAKEAFERHGFKVTAAPIGFHTDSDQPVILNLTPSTSALHTTGLLWRELIARFWYRLAKY